MSNADYNPFTRQDYDNWLHQERQIDQLMKLLDKVEGCGIACEQYRRIAEELRQKFALLRQTFFPSGPPV
jgi:hypothetical protein